MSLLQILLCIIGMAYLDAVALIPKSSIERIVTNNTNGSEGSSNAAGTIMRSS
jgi:hypothetical protein